MRLNKATIVLGLAAVAAVSSANLFTNGGFETGDLTGWTINPTSNGMTAVQDVQVFETVAGVPSRAGHFRVGQVSFSSGSQQGIELVQMLSLVAGVTYNFSYNVASFNSGGGNAEGGVFTAVVNSAFVGSTFTSGSIATNQTKRATVTGTFTAASSGLHSVGIRITRPFTTGASGLNQYVDNATAVPEPATMAVLGLGAAALIRRRKK